METQKVDMFLMSKWKFFEPAQIPMLRERLLALDDSKFTMLQSLELIDPTTLLIISILLGSLGIDRFMLGQVGLGVGKLLTAGGCGVWAIIDWFNIQKATQRVNFETIQGYIY